MSRLRVWGAACLLVACVTPAAVAHSTSSSCQPKERVLYHLSQAQKMARDFSEPALLALLQRVTQAYQDCHDQALRDQVMWAKDVKNQPQRPLVVVCEVDKGQSPKCRVLGRGGAPPPPQSDVFVITAPAGQVHLSK